MLHHGLTAVIKSNYCGHAGTEHPFKSHINYTNVNCRARLSHNASSRRWAWGGGTRKGRAWQTEGGGLGSAPVCFITEQALPEPTLTFSLRILTFKCLIWSQEKGLEIRGAATGQEWGNKR